MGIDALIALGLLAAVAAIAITAARLRLVRPDRLQLECCGCGCAISAIVVPAGAWLLWSFGGPAMAALAIPAWLPLSWALAWAPRACRRLVQGSSQPIRRRSPNVRTH